MGKTLIASKPILEQDLYNAFYNAYMTQYNNDPSMNGCDREAKSAIKKSADKFSSSLSKDMAQAIYDFVMEISIQVNVSGSIISPSGPCTGIIPPTNFIVS